MTAIRGSELVNSSQWPLQMAYPVAFRAGLAPPFLHAHFFSLQ
ncbi:MAG: hypothetical protein AAF564_25145 [Bacteroidota bacterium]